MVLHHHVCVKNTHTHKLAMLEKIKCVIDNRQERKAARKAVRKIAKNKRRPKESDAYVRPALPLITYNKHRA